MISSPKNSYGMYALTFNKYRVAVLGSRMVTVVIMFTFFNPFKFFRGVQRYRMREAKGPIKLVI